jgi:ferritin-like metal-binding protein YciE
MESEMELLEHELQDMYFAEKKMVKALDKLAKESTSDEMRQIFLHHKDETEGHVQRLEATFKMLGLKPTAHVCNGIMGLLKEKADFLKKEKPTDEILDMFNKGAAMKAEHYEISAYENILRILDDLDQTSIHALLSETLKEEKNALANLQALA